MKLRLAWPPQSIRHLDGSQPFNLIVLPAGHRPGLYEMKRAMGRKVAPTAGSVVVTSSWQDPDDGPQALVSPSLGLNATGPLGLASNVLVESDGSMPLIFSGVFTGVTGPADMSARACVVLLDAF